MGSPAGLGPGQQMGGSVEQGARGVKGAGGRPQRVPDGRGAILPGQHGLHDGRLHFVAIARI